MKTPHGPSAANDVRVANEGSIFMLYPLTTEARVWLTDHLAEDAQWFGGGVAVEHRYVQDVVRGMTADGLVVK